MVRPTKGGRLGFARNMQGTDPQTHRLSMIILASYTDRLNSCLMGVGDRQTERRIAAPGD